MSQATGSAPRKPRRARAIIQSVVTMGIWVSGLFLGAGTWAWPRGWISVAVYVIGMSAVGVVVNRTNPDLVVERSKWRRKDTKGFDRIFLMCLLPLATVQPLVAGLDAVRYRWSSVPDWLVAPGVGLFAVALALVGWTMSVNRHAETTVRIQTDRGHTVVTEGPYRTVRHPMYVGAILMNLATPMIWGSLAALAISGMIIGLFVWRTAMEDRTLHRELPGYAEYAARTRYRLVPGLW